MRNMQRGFTLMELMIVVSIIGILASMAIPAYLDHSIRSQIAEGINLVSGAKIAVTEFYQDRGAFPANNAAAGIEAAANIRGEYVTQVAVIGAGLIEVTFGNNVNVSILNAVLTFTAIDNSGSISWLCAGDAALVDKWLPPACR